MDIIDKETLDNAQPIDEVKRDNEVRPGAVSVGELSQEEFNRMLLIMSNPVDAQKEMAVKLKHYLDKKIEVEMREGYLSEFTRKWVKEYNDMLDKIQKSLHGEKSVNLHLHKVTHSQIQAKIRKAGESE